MLFRFPQKGSFQGRDECQEVHKIAKISKPTATRDIQKLVEMGVFQMYGAGRSTSYQIKLES